LENKEIDPVVIVANIGTEYMNTLVELSDLSMIIKPNTTEYIEILKNDYNINQAIIKTKNLLLKIEKGQVTKTEIQNEYLEISKIFNTESKVKKVNMLQGFTELLNDLEVKTEYIKTLFKKLDSYVLIDRGDFIIIAGRPSSGKTTIAVNMMINMSAKHTVDFFSLETTSMKVFRKIASSGGKININRLLHKNLQSEDYNKFICVADEFSRHKLNVIEASGMSVQDITSIAMQDKADIIFIDYLQLVNGKGANLYEQTTNISKDLHTFAQKEKITVVALSQLKRTDKREPTMSDLRESGQIEQDADAIIIMHNPEESEDINLQVRDAIIAKNKNGEIGKIRFKFYGGTQTFEEAYH
jgi:replicative DNA helicase